MIVISWYCFENIYLHPEISNQVKYFEFNAIPLFFGIAVFDFEGNNTVINLYVSMKEPQRFNSALMLSLFIYLVIVCAFSSLAYFVSLMIVNLLQAYGNEIEDMITLNLPHDNLTSLIQIFYCFGLLGSYPMQAFPVFEIIERSSRYRSWRFCFKWRLGWTKTYLVRTIAVLFTFVIAVSVP